MTAVDAAQSIEERKLDLAFPPLTVFPSPTSNLSLAQLNRKLAVTRAWERPSARKGGTCAAGRALRGEVEPSPLGELQAPWRKQRLH